MTVSVSEPDEALQRTVVASAAELCRQASEAAMAWELTIASADRSPLGDISAVRQAVEAAMPGVQFHAEPSGVEKMAAAGIEFPEVLRRYLENSPANKSDSSDRRRVGCLRSSCTRTRTGSSRSPTGSPEPPGPRS